MSRPRVPRMHQAAGALRPSGTTVRHVTSTSAISSCIQSTPALTADSTRYSATCVAASRVTATSLLLIYRLVITVALRLRDHHSSLTRCSSLAQCLPIHRCQSHEGFLWGFLNLDLHETLFVRVLSISNHHENLTEK